MMNRIDERLREASRDVHRAAETIAGRSLPHRSSRGPVIAAAAGFAIVIVIGVPALMTVGPADSGAAPSTLVPPDSAKPSDPAGTWVEPEVSAEVLADGGPVNEEIRAYWALQGTLASVGSEPGWLCPPLPNTGYSFIVDGSGLPPALTIELPGSTPVESSFRDSGPVCNQPPSLVLLAFTDQSRSDATAGVAVWPSIARFDDWCPPDSCSVEGSPEEGIVDPSPLEDLTVSGQSARLFTYQDSQQLWWVDPNGVPLYAKASGVTREQLVTLAESMTIDPTTQSVDISTPLPAGLEIVEQGPSIGIWESGLSRTDVYDIDGASVAIGTRFDRSETAYSRYSANVTFFELADLGNAKAAWFSEGGNFLFFEMGDGVSVYVDGAATREAAAQIAQDLR